MLAGGDDTKLAVYNTSDWKLVKEINRPDGISISTISSDNQYIMMDGEGFKISVYYENKCIAEREEDSFVYSCAFSPNDKFLA
mmetsp:Transcript_999/g.2055  ORF Transcript_999/g.2055 Transcript_999/m.2055 type:complete len:83 (-) Transcript_999:176-424(-)